MIKQNVGLKKNELYEINEIKVTRKIFSIIILNYMKI